jgi:hypothetical protein
MESLVAAVASPAAGGKLGRSCSDDQLVPLWLADLQDDDTASDSSTSELLALQRDLDCSAASTTHEFEHEDEHEEGDEEDDDYDDEDYDASPGFDDFYYSRKDCGAYSVEARNKGRNRPKRCHREVRGREPRIKQRAGARALMTMQENREPFVALDCLRLPPAAMRRVACAHCHKSLDTTAFASSQLRNKKAGSARCRVCVAQMHAAFLQQLPPRKYKMSTVKAKTRDVRSSVDPKALARKCSGAISGSIEFNR